MTGRIAAESNCSNDASGDTAIAAAWLDDNNAERDVVSAAAAAAATAAANGKGQQ